MSVVVWNELLGELGQSMDRALPFKEEKWLLRVARASRFTEKVLFPVTVEADDEVYRRVWLERACAKRPAESPVELFADYVVINQDLDDQSNQFARHGRLIARLAQGQTTLEGQLPEATSVTEMINWVDEVANAEKARQIREAVSLTHLSLAQRVNLDSVPGMSFPVS